jgi:PAS domain S-box-containing protein
MFNLSPAALGLLLILLGVTFALLTLLLMRLIPRPRPIETPPSFASSPSQAEAQDEAVLVVQRGGRLIYLNHAARELFDFWETDLNLESLARRARPGETFLMLCANEGQARFHLNGRFVEGSSYFLPGDIAGGQSGLSAMLVTLRRPKLVLDHRPIPTDGSEIQQMGQEEEFQPATNVSGQAFGFFTELTQAMASSLDLETTLQTILENFERLFPSDYMEITIWDADAGHAVPYRLVGLAGVDRHLEKGAERYTPDRGYSGYLISRREPLLIRDTSTFREAQPAVDRQRYPFKSYLGAPLLIAGELVGTLELASLTKDNYTENDLEVVRLLAGQAAAAVNNALLYRKELQRSIELAGLANLAQAATALQEPQELYSRLIANISPLLNVEILGFLIYDETRRALEGQEPFQGLQANVIEWCRTTILPDSPAEALWLEADPIVVANAPEDPRIQALELHHLARAAGIRNTVLMPLSSAGRMVGYLQAANKRDETPFDSNDLRILSIIAGQVAPIIDNARLALQSRRRAQRAETLRRIASLTSSAATLDEMLKYSILDLARLLQADAAAIYLLDEGRGELRLQRNANFGIAPQISSHLGRISSEDPLYTQTAASTQQQLFITDLEVESGALPAVYHPFAKHLKTRTLIITPLVIRERGIGELIVGSFRANFFSSGDAQTIATAAGLLAAAIDRAALYTQTDQSLRQRVEQLVALTRISRELNTTLKLEDLLQRVYDEALRTTQADCGAVMLFQLDDLQENNVAPQAPTIQFYIGDEPGAALHPLELQVFESGETVIVPLFQEQAPHPQSAAPQAATAPANVKADVSPVKAASLVDLYPAHQGVHSAMATPIAYQGRVAGVIHLHARVENRFGETERDIVEALAIQAAIAIGNAHRYQEQQRRSEELNQRVETLSKIFEVSQIVQTEQPLEQSLEAIAYAIQSATPFDVVLISIYDSSQNQLVRLVGAGIPLPELDQLRSRPASWASLQTLLEPRFRLGRSYFIPAELAGELPPDLYSYTPPQIEPAPADPNAWQPDDIFLMPLFGIGGDPLGLISVDAPRNNARPDRNTIEALEIFGTQAALAIETQLKVRDLRAKVMQIEEELALAQLKAEKAQSHLPVLLHKDLEQTLAIQSLSQRARRIRAGLEIAEAISAQASPAEVLRTLGQKVLERMDFDMVFIAEQSDGGPNLTLSLGNYPAEANPKALLGQRNPLRHTLQSGEILFASNMSENPEWQNTPLLRALDAHSFLCIPIPGAKPYSADPSSNGGSGNGRREARPYAAMLAVNRAPITPFTNEDRQLFDLMVRQAAIALQNLSLQETTSRRLKEVNLLLDFSRQLGSLDPTSILNTLVDSALRLIPTAQMALVALWNDRLGALEPQASSGYPNPDELTHLAYRSGEGVPGLVFTLRQAVNLETVDFTRHYNLSPENLLAYRNATGGRLPVSTLAVPIIASPGGPNDTFTSMLDSQIQRARTRPLGVLVLDSVQTTAAFTANDLAVASSLAQQTALTLENARLYQASRHRSNQLQALTEVSTSITSSLQSQELTASLLDQLRRILPYDTGTLWLRQKSETTRGSQSHDRMVIRAARGFSDSEERIGLTVDIQDSALMNEMINTGRPIWVADVRKDARFRALTQEEVPEETAQAPGGAGGVEHLSWLGVPLIASGRVLGVIALEKVEPNFYTNDDIQLATTFAGQAAVSLENAELYEESVKRALELDQRTQTLSILNRLSYELSGSLDAARILDFAVQEFMQLMNCTSASALLVDRGYPEVWSTEGANLAGLKATRLILQAEFPYFEDASTFYPGASLPNIPLFERLQESLGIFNTDDVSQESELAPLQEFLAHHQTRSLLVVPIASGASGGERADFRFHGILLAHDRRAYRFNAEKIELARTISNQIAIALQNARLLEETLSLTEDLELRVQERTAELAHERQRAETLLRIITELSASLDLEQVLHRTLQVLSEFVDAAQITILIARPGEKKLQRLASIGYTPEPNEHGSPTPFDSDQGLAGWIISQRQAVLIPDVMVDERWVRLDYSEEDWKPTYQHRSAMGVPLMSGAEALGCLLLFHPDIGHFSLDQLDLVQAAANQVSIAVNNAELYRLIRDQAEDLGTMLRNQQIETSRSKAILEAVADGVLVTDANRIITLFNESAEKILGLERSLVLGKSMEHFSGLFGRGTRRWMEVIQSWSQDPSAYQSDGKFAEQITLEDGRVIFVQLAPVSLRNDFLGTVSIFQDITHQVEVDRLKSEFVATVSHELRTPMTSIKGYVDILLMGAAGALTEQQAHFLQVVKANTERLAVLVNDLLDISQIEAGRMALAMQPLNLEELVLATIEDFKRRIQEDQKGITVEAEIQPNLPRVMADFDRIRRVMDNLLENAYQYNLPNGQILVRMHVAGDEVQVDVKDTGVGIHPDDQERVFERFFRGESTLTLGVAGTGLGLSIVRNLITMHNGRIWLQSTGIPGEGSTFSFTLPIYKPGNE